MKEREHSIVFRSH